MSLVIILNLSTVNKENCMQTSNGKVVLQKKPIIKKWKLRMMI